MATTEQIFEFNASKGIDNIKNLRKEIKDLKSSLEQLEIGSEEYEKTSEKLWEKQSRLTDVMKESKRPLEDAAGSYNALNKELVELRKTYRALSEEQRNSDFGTDILLQIQSLDAKLKASDAQMGQYFRNVGNYTNSIVDAFKQMGFASTSLDGPLKKVGVNIEGVTNYIKVLQVVVNQFSLTNITAAFDKATAGVKAFVGGLSAMQKALLVTGIGILVTALGTIIAYWDDIKEAISKTKTPMEVIIDQTNDYVTALQDARDEEDKVARLMAAMGASELEIAAMRTRTLKDQLAETNKKIEDQETELASLETWWKRIGRAVMSVLQYIIPVSDVMKEMLGMGGKVDGLKSSLDTLKETRKELGESIDNASLEEYILLNKEDTKTTKNNAAAKKELTEEEKALAEAVRMANADLDAIIKQREREEEADKKRYEKALEMQEELQFAQLSELEQEEVRYKEKLALFEEYGLDTELVEEEHQQRMADIRAEEARRIYKELEEQAAEKKKKDDEVEANYKKLMKARQDATKTMVSGTSGLLKNLSQAMGESTKMGKGFAIAAATIDTIASAVAGFRAGMNQWADAGPMAWMAPVQAAINAALAITAGMAEVQKIQSVDTSGNATAGGGGAAVLAMPNIEGLSSPVDYTRQVTTQTEQEEMNRDNRVYILESDIQESGNRVRIREEETTF